MIIIICICKIRCWIHVILFLPVEDSRRKENERRIQPMMNMIYVPAMNHMMSEDVNVPALRNPLNHTDRKQQKKETGRNEERKGWIDGWMANRRNH